ncbi:30S ribosomal protein S5 [Candidatus Omnitrophota bacterium]
MGRRNENKDALLEKVISINRVTKVTKGGKNMNFSALVVVGDAKGNAGFALGKAPEVAEAIRKGMSQARKHLVAIDIENTTLPHEVIGKYGAIKVLLKPASLGTGVIACLAVRSICEVAGIKNILTKLLTKSTNPINVVKATFAGFKSIKPLPSVQPVQPEPPQPEPQQQQT